MGPRFLGIETAHVGSFGNFPFHLHRKEIGAAATYQYVQAI